LGLNEAITRGIAFKQAGADAVFIEAPESKDEMKEISRQVPGPLVANHVKLRSHEADVMLDIEDLKAARSLMGLLAWKKNMLSTRSTAKVNSMSSQILRNLVLDKYYSLIGIST
jgi:2-methylisocitrate lyase-like PEP mutase family enzyme